MTGLRVLVTGAGGFVGHAVASRLAAAGHQVTGLIRQRPMSRLELPPGVRIAFADLTARDQVAEVVRAGEFDAVCHTAAMTRVRDSFEQPIHYFDVNVAGTLHLLDALREATQRGRAWTRLVFASTVAVYGRVDSAEPLREDRPPQPANPYGASKLAAEQLVTYQAATGALGAVTLRCFNVAGAVDGRGDHDLSRVIPMALAVAAGEVPSFSLNGDGSVVREFVHVADVADAFLSGVQAARQGENTTVNVGSGAGVTMRQVLETVERVTGRSVPMERRPPKNEPAFLVANIVRAREALGWFPRRSDLDVIVRDAWDAVRRRSSPEAMTRGL